MNEALGISVVVPMYNEVENVEPLIQEIVAALKAHPEFEVIVVDDGSKDGTYEKLLSLEKSVPALKVLKHVRNSGQSAGVVTGVYHAQFPWIATLDGDGQNDPADIPKLMQAIQQVKTSQKFIVAAGHRNQRKDTFLRRLSSKIANGIRARLLRDDCPDSGCGIKLFPRELFLKIPHFNHVHRFLPALFKRQGAEVINIPVNHRPRMRGTSKYGVMNRLWVGISDLLGVVWLIRRPCNPEVKS